MTSQFFADTDVNIMVTLAMTENGSIGRLIVSIKVSFRRRTETFSPSSQLNFQHFWILLGDKILLLTY